jgi:hypothetical protein
VNREQTELRAERLRVQLAMFGELQTDFAGAYRDAAPRMSAGDHALFQTTTAADTGLANACLEIASEQRRREWAGLETLLSCLPLGGDLESVYELPAAQALPALRGAQVCGWLNEAAA